MALLIVRISFLLHFSSTNPNCASTCCSFGFLWLCVLHPMSPLLLHEASWRIFLRFSPRASIIMECTLTPESSDYIFRICSSGRYQFVSYSVFVSHILPSAGLQKFLYVALSCAVLCPDNSICLSLLGLPAPSLQFRVSPGLCPNFPSLHHGVKTLSRQ